MGSGNKNKIKLLCVTYVALGYRFSLCELKTSFAKRFPFPGSGSFQRIHSGHQGGNITKNQGKNRHLSNTNCVAGPATCHFPSNDHNYAGRRCSHFTNKETEVQGEENEKPWAREW